MSHKAAGFSNPVQGNINGPVLLGLEIPDFLFPVHHHPGGNALNPSGRQSPTDFLPQQRGKLITHNPVQNSPGLLGIHQIIVDFPGMLDGLLHHLLGNFIEGDSPGLFIRQRQKFFQVPGDGLSLPVRVRCQINGVRLVGLGLQFLDQGFLPPDRNVLWCEIMLQIHAHFTFGQVPKVAHAGLHNIVRAQIAPNGFRFGGRLHNHKITCFCHVYLRSIS